MTIHEYRVVGRRSDQRFEKTVTVREKDFILWEGRDPTPENIRRWIVHRMVRDGIIVQEIMPAETSS